MPYKTDTLQFFENVYAKKQYAFARFLHFLLQYRMALKNYRSVIVSSWIALAILGFYITSLIVRLFLLPFLITLILVLESLATGAFLLMMKVSLYLAKRFSMKLYVGIRDYSFFLIPFAVFVIYFPLSRLFSEIFSAVFVAVVFIVAEIIVAFLYETKLAVKKQHDLDISRISTADPCVDILLLDEDGFEKNQINGDTRNALPVSLGKPRRFKLNKKASQVKFAIGCREFIENCADDIEVVLELSDASTEKPLVIFRKVMNIKSEYEERFWLEEEILFDWARVDFLTHEFSIHAYSTGKKAKKACCYLSEPRVKKNGSPPKKVIFVVFDAVRHDHLGCYGYARNTSPVIDAFAKDCVQFNNAFVQGEWTLTSFMSFLTALYPSTHGVFHPTLYQSLSPKALTVPLALRNEGFITKCFFTHKRLVSNFGFAKGFDSHIFRQCDKENKIANADDVISYGIDTLAFHKNDDLFLMLHFFDTHQPCNPPSPYTDLFDKAHPKRALKDVRTFLLRNSRQCIDSRDVENLISRYDAEINRLDLRFGMLLDYLRSSGQYDDALIIFTGDHGMLLGDHGDLSTIQLFDETLKVPLLLKFPSRFSASKNRKVESAFIEANLDLMPTILDVCGVSVSANIQGKSLAPFAQQKFADSDSFRPAAVSESFFNQTYTVSIRDAAYRYIAKMPFDYSSFKNIKAVISSEEIYSTGGKNPEKKIELSEKIALKFREAALKHIERSRERARELTC